MVPLMSLWLPILVSAVIVFVASSIIHMALGYHNSDFGKVAAEDPVREALRQSATPPGQYAIPHAASNSERAAPEYIAKAEEGPVALLTVLPNGMPAMGGQLVKWFLYCVVVGVFAAYISGRALGPGAHYLAVFRFAGCAAIGGYVLALWQGYIWYKRPLSFVAKNTIDGVVYGLLTAGAFGWLWPAT